MYLISAYFDQRTTKTLQKYIDRIARETGNTFMTKNHVPPHMTISAIEARNVEALVPAVDALQGKLECGPVQFACCRSPFFLLRGKSQGWAWQR